MKLNELAFCYGCKYQESCVQIQADNLKYNSKNKRTQREFTCPIIVKEVPLIKTIGELVIRALQHDENAINELKERGLW